MTAKPTLAPEFWERLAREETHPMRIRIVETMASPDNEFSLASPVLLATFFDVKLGTLSYHVKALAEVGVLELVDTIPRRGAVEHVYRLADWVATENSEAGTAAGDGEQQPADLPVGASA